MGRRLGQHFLHDPSILDRIVDALDPTSDDVVIEIGPGLGTLTRRLAPRVGAVVAIERDARLAEELREGAGAQPRLANVAVVAGDALSLDWHELLAAQTAHAASVGHKIIGNIPYYITSPLIEKALTAPFPVCIVYTVQREVADRLAAKPGSKSYGALSVGVQVAAQVERLLLVPAGAFRPPPNVASAVVRLVPRADSLIAASERPAFRRFVTSLFGRRRKQLGRALRGTTGLSRGECAGLLADLGIDPESRAEVHDPQTLVRVFRTRDR